MHTGFPYSALDELQNYVGQPDSYRLPTLAALDLRLSRDFRISFVPWLKITRCEAIWPFTTSRTTRIRGTFTTISLHRTSAVLPDCKTACLVGVWMSSTETGWHFQNKPPPATCVPDQKVSGVTRAALWRAIRPSLGICRSFPPATPNRKYPKA